MKPNQKSETKERPEEIREGVVESKEMVEKGHVVASRHITLDELLFYGLITFAVIGVAISQASIAVGRVYWLSMIPLIAAASLYVEWAHARGMGIRWSTLLRTQLFHWGALLVSVELVYMLYHFGQVDKESIGMFILLLLAQTTFLVGVYLDWRFSVVGLFLVASLIALAYLEAYIWLIAILAIGIIVLGLFLHRRF